MFYVIDKTTKEFRTFDDARSVSIWLLGKRVGKTVIIKEGKLLAGERKNLLYTPSVNDVTVIQRELERLDG